MRICPDLEKAEEAANLISAVFGFWPTHLI
jgi:hypothetical protein